MRERGTCAFQISAEDADRSSFREARNIKDLQKLLAEEVVKGAQRIQIVIVDRPRTLPPQNLKGGRSKYG